MPRKLSNEKSPSDYLNGLTRITMIERHECPEDHSKLITKVIQGRECLWCEKCKMVKKYL
jgi:hypothetical protein